MKKYFLLSLATLFLSGLLKAQDSEAFKKFSTFNVQQVFEKIFDAKMVKKNDYTWKPVYSDLFDFSNHISYDNYCHTHMDTIFDLTAEGSTYWLLIFETDKYESKDQIADCHSCAPLISVALFRRQADKSSILEGFKKGLTSTGSFGKGPQYRIEKIASDKYALVIESGYTGQGMTTVMATYYSLTSIPFMTTLFSYEIENSDGNSGAEEFNILKTAPNPTSENYFDFFLTNKKNGKISPVKKRFVFYEEGNIYIPAK